MSRAPRVCPSCAAKNHPKWRTCQRCGGELTAPAIPARPDTTDARETAGTGKGIWIGAAVLTCLVIAGGAAVLRSPQAAPARVPKATATPAEGRAVQDTSGETPTGAGLASDTRNDLVRESSAAYNRGDFDAALAILQRTVAANPRDAVAQNNLGQVLVRLNRLPEALTHLAAAVALQPENWSYRFNIARAEGLSGNWPAAVESYQQADQLFPDDHVTLFNLAQALQKANRQADAIPVLERVVAAAPDDPSFLLTLGSALEQGGRASDAAATFSKYLDAAPNATDAAAVKAHLARLQGRLGADSPAAPGGAQATPEAAPDSAPADPGTTSPAPGPA